MPSRALIIEARFYEDIADMLLAGASAELKRRGFGVEVVTVPGALEIPPALAIALASSRRREKPFDLFVALGCVIRGETTHYDTVAGESCRGLMELAVGHRLALGNGILTVENREQAVVRADPAQKDKGGDAAAAAIALFELRNALK